MSSFFRDAFDISTFQNHNAFYYLFRRLAFTSFGILDYVLQTTLYLLKVSRLRLDTSLHFFVYAHIVLEEKSNLIQLLSQLHILGILLQSLFDLYDIIHIAQTRLS